VALAGVRQHLPVWAVVTRSYAYVWERRSLFAVPMLLVFIVELAASLYIRNAGPAAPDAPPGTKGLVFLVSIAVTIFSMSVIVGVHRTVLLGDIRPGISFLRWDGNLLRYVGTSLLLAAIGMLLATIFILLLAIVAGLGGMMSAPAGRGAFGIIAAAAAFILLFAFFLRFMLALPAAAVGVQQDRLGVSWKATHGNWLRLFATGFLTALPLIVLNILVALPAIDQVSQAMAAGQQPVAVPQPVAILVVSAAIKAVNLAVLTVMLSLCYDVLVRGGGPPAKGN
jgi:hypothetical protein